MGMRIFVAMVALSLGACASGGAGRDVNAVVQDEGARQAAAAAAQQGAGSEAAVTAGAEAAPKSTPAAPAGDPPR